MNIPINAGKQAIRASDTKPPSGQQQVIEWKPIVDQGNRLSFQGTSFKSTRAALVATFGQFPLRLNNRDHRMPLTAMLSVAKANGEGGAPYEQLVVALQKFGDLEVSEL